MNDSPAIVRRDERGRLLPGSVINKNGMRKGTRHFSTLFKEAIKKIDAETGDSTDITIVKAQLQKAKKGDPKAYEIIRDEIDGPLPKADNAESGNTYNITVVNFNADNTAP